MKLAIRPRVVGRARLLLAIGVVVLTLATDAHAYVGPGAGFAVGTTLFAFFVAFFSGLAAIFLWPFRWMVRSLRGRRAPESSLNSGASWSEIFRNHAVATLIRAFSRTIPLRFWPTPRSTSLSKSWAA